MNKTSLLQLFHSMKVFPVLIPLIFFGCHRPVKESIDKLDTLHLSNPILSQDFTDKRKFYIKEDSLVITTQNNDTLKYTKAGFNEIVDNFPELYSKYPVNPDLTYACSNPIKELSANNGNIKHISFSSETGQDKYYILYAYFLRKQFRLDQYDKQRHNLVVIYNDINAIYGSLNFGGTYFGHQYRRIAGYAEFAIYQYNQNSGYYDKDYGIKKQKVIYINSLRQFVRDELADEKKFNQAIISMKNKNELRSSLEKLIKEIESLITDNFYLKNAQRFQHTYY